MPLRAQSPLRWQPEGLSDAFDSGGAFEGAMSSLSNLVPSSNNNHLFVPRPAATQLTGFPGITSPRTVTCILTVGDTVYGMISSADFSGKDEPFVYNLLTNSFLTISGKASANLPATQPTTGDWTPPTVALVGSRVIFTHPGFPGGASDAPYYNLFFFNTTNLSNVITGIDPTIFPFLAVGQKVIAAGVPPGATITAVSFPIVYVAATGTSGTNTVTVASATGIVVGQTITGPGIPNAPPTTVTNVAGTTITLSANLGQNLTAATVEFLGSVINLSANATATGTVQGTVISSFGMKFGWLDLSGFTLTTQGNTFNNQLAITGNPTIIGVQPGMSISGTGIAAGTTIQATAAIAMQIACAIVSGSNVATYAQSVAPSTMAVGMGVAGSGIPLGTTVVSFTGNAATLSQNATSSGTVTLTFSGALIFLSQAATANGTTVQLSIAGGSQTSPQWGAGDTNTNGLAAVPVFVEQFFGRAYFGVNASGTSGVTASDSGIPTQVSNANQIITFSDGIPVTASSGLALFNQLGGIIQSLMVFQGSSNIRQITGDFSLGNWSQNSLQTATGTQAPNAIASTPKGLLFVAPDGLRLIDFDARVSEVIGVRGEGVTLPFIYAVTPTRMQAAYNENVYRVTITWQNPSSNQALFGVAPGATATQEFWYHLDTERWSGPHTWLSDQLAPWQSKNSFVSAPPGGGGLWRTDVLPTAASTYTENGTAMTWTFGTSLLPDNPEMMANGVNETTIFMSLPATTQALATAIDDQGYTLDQAYVFLGPTVTRGQLPIWWHKQLIFRQMTVSITGPSSGTVLVGTLNLRYQRLGYQFTPGLNATFVAGASLLGGPDVLGP